MKYVALLAAAAVFTACSGGKTPQAEKQDPAPAAEPKARAGQVTLTAEAQRSSGITVEPVQLQSLNAGLSATGELTVNEDRKWYSLLYITYFRSQAIQNTFCENLIHENELGGLYEFSYP